mmetsp:Transcript_22230/g.19066  ORF Transcript_22230/g.19066 Transcript_22230/m.19066 type:complete len:130 (+) Transcript_22230:1122-1511(+)
MQEYLLEKGKISDPNWLDNYLYPQFKKALIHLTRASKWSGVRFSQVYKYWGIDFIMDDDLNVYFIEANSGPGLNPNNEEKDRVFRSMLYGMFEIEFGLLRSRIKRIVNFVNRVDAEFKNSGLELQKFLR